MILLVGAFLVSLLPPLGLFLWLRGIEGDPEFTGICNKALTQGMICTGPVIACSLLFVILEWGLTRIGLSGVPRAAYHNFMVLAFSEELCKFLMFRRLLAKYERAWSWTDYIILMTIVGIGFGLLESLLYAVSADAFTMIVRGITSMHGGYGFIMGYFMGKAQKTGNKAWSAVGFGLPWLLHGSYDFGLSEAFAALGDATPLLSVSLAVLALVTLIVLIVFFIRHRNDKRYTAPIVELPNAEPEGQVM